MGLYSVRVGDGRAVVVSAWRGWGRGLGGVAGRLVGWGRRAEEDWTGLDWAQWFRVPGKDWTGLALAVRLLRVFVKT